MSPGDRIESIITGRLATILEVGYDKVLIQFDGFTSNVVDRNTIYTLNFTYIERLEK